MTRNIHDDFFTDNQVAVVLGMTLASLRNKIYRHKNVNQQTLPVHQMAASRGRVWLKKDVRSFLQSHYTNKKFVDQRMTLGEKAPALGKEGASLAEHKLQPIGRQKTG